MEFWDVIKNRQSTRLFKNLQIEEEKLKRVLEAGRLAPSAGNTQDWYFIVIKNEKIKRKIWENALNQDSIISAPVVLIICSNLNDINVAYGQRGIELYSKQDTAIAATCIWLAAVDEGLSGVWIGAFDEDGIKKALNLNDNLRPMVILCLGYADEKPELRVRKRLGEIIKMIK